MTDRSTELLRAALRVALVETGAQPAGSDVDRIRAAGEGEWARLLPDLENHRLGPLLWDGFRRRGLAQALPRLAREELEGARRGTLLANTVQRQFLARLLEGLGARGIEPIVMKGVVLESWLYPDLGTRPMVDIDLSVDATEEASAAEFLRRSGFERRAPWAAFVDPASGLAVDLHCARPDACPTVTRRLDVPGAGAVDLRTWEANATLIGLAAHLEKHTTVIGPALLWVLDIVLLASRSDTGLSLGRLRELDPEGDTLEFLWQVLRLGLDEFGVAPHGDLAGPVEASRALSLPWVLRQRRLQRWGFPRPRFYARLTARLLRLRPLEGRLWPRPLDLPNGWIDAVVDRRTVPASGVRAHPAPSTRSTSSSS